MTQVQKPQRNQDAGFLSRFIDDACAGRPMGYRRDELQEAVRRLVEQLEAVNNQLDVEQADYSRLKEQLETLRLVLREVKAAPTRRDQDTIIDAALEVGE